MHADRISVALTRIETAALRIAEAARRGPAPRGEDGDAQYQALRREAASALAELDQVIARLDP